MGQGKITAPIRRVIKRTNLYSKDFDGAAKYYDEDIGYVIFLNSRKIFATHKINSNCMAVFNFLQEFEAVDRVVFNLKAFY